MSLVNNREVAYEALFLGELPYESQPNEQDIGLSGLWRAHTVKKGSNGNDLNDFLETIPATVTAVLSQHNTHANSEIGDDGQAIFGLVDPTSSLPIIANIVAKTVSTWEKSLWRNKYDSITARSITGDPTKQNQSSTTDSVDRERLAHRLACESLIIETAAAAMTVLPLWAKRPLHPTMTEQKNIAKVLANWGPQFTIEWLSGSILNTWLQAQDITGEDNQQWQKLFSPSMLRQFAVYYINDPMSALDRVKTNLELMTDEAIANRLGWDEDQVRDTFSPVMRKYIAIDYVEPLAALDRVKTNLELMTDEAIANRLGWDEDQVRDVFSPSLRKYFATRNINDPFSALDRVKTNLALLTDDVIANRLGWETAQVKDVFSPSIRKYFAVCNIKDPMSALKRVAVNLDLLTDEAIANRLGWDEDQVRDAISPNLRLHFATKYIKDPLAALDRAENNLELLTDEAIANRLGWSTAQVKDVFSPSIRKYFAVNNIKDPMTALNRVAVNLDLLTDEAIANRLGWDEEQVIDTITLAMRKYFAFFYINDPLTGIENFATGKIAFGGKFCLN